MATDIITLVDRLEDLLGSGRRLPVLNKILVDEQECLDIVDQMRVFIPDEIRQARRVNQERERMLQAAKEEADRMLQEAEAHVLRQIQERGLLQAAEQRSMQIVGAAERQAQEVRAGADRYAEDVLGRLESQLAAGLDEVQNGIDRLGGE